MNDFKHIDSGYSLPSQDEQKSKPIWIALIVFAIAVAIVLFLFRHLDNPANDAAFSGKNSSANEAKDLRALTPDALNPENVVRITPKEKSTLRRPSLNGGL